MYHRRRRYGIAAIDNGGGSCTEYGVALYAQCVAFPAHVLLVLSVFALFPRTAMSIGDYDITGRGERSIANYIEHQYGTFIASYCGLYDGYGAGRYVLSLLCVAIPAQVYLHPWFWKLAKYTLAPPLHLLGFFGPAQ